MGNLGVVQGFFVLLVLGLCVAQPPPGTADYSGIYKPGSTGKSPAMDTYTALAQVNIRCRSDKANGLLCAADYPDHCREQWNFVNPCTRNNLDSNITKFRHPSDKTKFLMCGQYGKLFIVQCPQYEEFHVGCGQCVDKGTKLSERCEVPLPPVIKNPCTREAILANKLFFPFHGNLSMFIHCDIWGKPWERICTPGEVWSQWAVTCVLPHLLNPCNRPMTEINYLYGHPCDPVKYLTCDIQGRAHEINCAMGEAFDETQQRCLPYSAFKDQILSSYCEDFVFGFRQFHGSDRLGIGFNRTAEYRNLGLVTNEGSQIAGNGNFRDIAGTISGIRDQGIRQNNKGFTIDRTTRKIDGTVSVTRDLFGQGVDANIDLTGGVLNRQTDLQGQGEGTAAFDRTTKLRGGSIQGQINTDGQGNFGGTLDVKRGSLSGSSSGTVGQGSLNQGFQGGDGTIYTDIRKNTGPGTAEYVDIRNTGTSGTNVNMLDIRGEKGSGSGAGISGSMTDIRRQGSTGPGMADIRNTGVRNMEDIRVGTIGTGASGSMTDIKRQGSTSPGMADIRYTGAGKMEDIRVGTIGSGESGSMTDIRRQGSTSPGMADIRNTGVGKMEDIRVGGRGSVTDIGGSGTGLSGSMTDIRRQGSTSPGMADIRNTGVRNMEDIRVGTIGSGASGSMTDIRRQGSTSPGMADIRYTGAGKMEDIRVGTIGSGASGSMADIRRQGSTSPGMADIRNTGVRNMEDIRVGTIGSGASGSMTDIRRQGSTSPGMADIRYTGAGKMEDIRVGTIGTGVSGSMTDIRRQGSTSPGMADIRYTGVGKMEDIRVGGRGSVTDIGGSGTGVSGSMTDIRRQGSTSPGMADIRYTGAGKMEDIRVGNIGSGVSGSMTDIRRQGSTSPGMADIRNTGVRKMEDIRVGTIGSATDMSGSGTGVSGSMTDIRRQGSTSPGMADIRNTGVGKMEDIRVGGRGSVTDIGGSGTGVSGSMTDIRRQGSTSPGMADIRYTGAGKMEDIRVGTIGSATGMSGSGTGVAGSMTDIRRQGSTSPGMADIRNAGVRRMEDIRVGTTGSATGIGGSGTGVSGSMTDIRRQTTGSAGSSMGAKTSIGGNMVDVRTPADSSGMTKSRFLDVRGTRTITDTNRGGAIDGMSDIRDGKASMGSNLIDIRYDPSGGLVDLSGSKTGMSGSLTDIRTLGSQTNAGNMADIRTGQATGTNSGMVDVRRTKKQGAGGTIGITSGSDGTRMVDISTGRGSASIFDITGTGTINEGTGVMGNGNAGISGNLAGIRNGVNDVGLVDSTGTGQVTLDGTNSGIAGQNKATWIDVRGQRFETKSSQQWQNKQNLGSSSASNQNGLGSMTSLDLRNQLGLDGQSSIGNNDITGTIKTETITIDGNIQGGRQGTGTMNDLLNTWNQIIETGSTATRGGRIIQTGPNQPGNGKIIDTSIRIHPSRLREYQFSNVSFTEPCTQANLDAGRTHFRFRGHPHMFLQCDASGRMHRMPCTGQDWFDYYTNTCVDGPVHVDNQVFR